ncbi:ABC transporter substrate-binding protein [Marinobacterium sediminicola]|uniref:Branched-chain amino acid transport system substrate-binding protein n=1 Tax=Marinobacterium sediminicola TaxID=518898 RepID=A0ABY1RW01_9GAMM|nr:ABC transporter substrate-binding protein [Marinobacterium sediminicola]ULG70486.1 ABC transporter substrate-binding protein [Marinobacterium sediminicola]SMR69204.1 branched-chain amino acid transport system substrate-binding protein [Marinobacterium sediminicola]
MKMMKKTLLAASVAAFASTAAMANVTDGKVKIGVLADMGGTYADVCGPGCVTAIEMAVEDFGGTVLGAPIEVVSADDQLKPDVGSAIVRKWIEDEQVDAVGGLVSSAVTGAATKVLTDAKKIALISTSASNAFTTKACSPYNVHWTYNVVALANGTVKPMVEAGKKKWFFITADYAFGHALEGVASKVINENGGEVVGAARAPLGTTDFSSYILQAQSSGADVVALANAGNDTVNSLKAASEFGLTQMMDVAGLLVFTPNAQAMDPNVAGGMRTTTGFYWDLDDQTREWSKRFMERHGAIPAMGHAGAYSMTMHYLKAIEAAGTDESDAVMKKMKEMKPDDFFARNATLRADGRMVHDMYYVEIKKPEERRDSNDIFKVVSVIPGDQAFAPMLPECDFK